VIDTSREASVQVGLALESNSRGVRDPHVAARNWDAVGKSPEGTKYSTIGLIAAQAQSSRQ
jgi:hypothetical protein